MSWNWKEEEEKKEYETKGTVTISTEEYRDLIERVQELKAAGQREHDDWYEEYNRARDLEKKVKALEDKVAEFNAWIDSDDRPDQNLRSVFKQWKLKKLEEAENE
jgi:hypothetical protein